MTNELRPYQICTRCIMDTTDPKIRFDEHGVCNHCKHYDSIAKRFIQTRQGAPERLQALVSTIQRSGKGKSYDCVIGVSGGVDSTYLAYEVKRLGLRPLAIHFDNGWNSELAVSNIEKTLKHLGIDLFTYVVDWEEFKDLQMSFLKASTPDSEVPTDHAIVALLHQMAAKHHAPYIIIGSNVATEGILPSAWSHGHIDWKYIKGIQKRFGSKKLKTYPHYSLFQMAYWKLIRKIRSVSLLNLIDYNKDAALKTIEQELGWRNYGYKHYESIYTRFFQGYILPKKFHYDKRRGHLSTLVCSGQIARQQALEEIQKDAYDQALLSQDLEFALKKFELTPEQFETIMGLPPKSFWDYPSYEMHPLYGLIIKAYEKVTKQKIV